jgi:hypothetical protein
LAVNGGAGIWELRVDLISTLIWLLH